MNFGNKYLYITIIALVLLTGLSFGLLSKTTTLENPSESPEVVTESRIPDLMEAAGINYLENILDAPNFILESLDGTEIELQELEGNTVLLGFWATW